MYVKMKSYSYFIFLTLFLTSCLKQKNDKVEILINNWEFRELGQKWFPAIVPGSVHLDLYTNNLVDDPFYRVFAVYQKDYYRTRRAIGDYYDIKEATSFIEELTGEPCYIYSY